MNADDEIIVTQSAPCTADWVKNMIRKAITLTRQAERENFRRKRESNNHTPESDNGELRPNSSNACRPASGVHNHSQETKPITTKVEIGNKEGGTNKLLPKLSFVGNKTPDTLISPLEQAQEIINQFNSHIDGATHDGNEFDTTQINYARLSAKTLLETCTNDIPKLIKIKESIVYVENELTYHLLDELIESKTQAIEICRRILAQ